MSEQKHTPEPWGRRHNLLIDDDGGWFGDMCNNDHAKRVQACVNALAGIDDPDAFMRDVRAELAKLEARYDALLAHHASELGSVMAEVRDEALEEAAVTFDKWDSATGASIASMIRALKGKTDA